MQEINQLQSRMTKPLALALAFVCLFFLLQVVPHGHANGQDEAACRLCQVAHLGVAPAVATMSLDAPLVPVGRVATRFMVTETEPFYAHSPSRAPPSFEL